MDKPRRAMILKRFSLVTWQDSVADKGSASLLQGSWMYILAALLQDRPDGEIGRRKGLKIPRSRTCRFDPGSGHHS